MTYSVLYSENCCITRPYTADTVGPTESYSCYTARAYTAVLYRIQPIHYTALYADPLDTSVRIVASANTISHFTLCTTRYNMQNNATRWAWALGDCL